MRLARWRLHRPVCNIFLQHRTPRNCGRHLTVRRSLPSDRDMCCSSAAHLPQVLVVTGPTAVGKTQLSLALAQKLNGEIISADSVQVYKGLDIGSDKISVPEQLGVPHHLLDILPADAEFSAGHFYDLARAAIEDIVKRGKLPIVVGGTGLYLRWLVHGRPQTPQSDPAMTAKAQDALDQVWSEAQSSKGQELTAEEKWDLGCGLIAKLGDPVTAERVSGEMNNYYRLLRVLEIVMHTGQTLKQLDTKSDAPLDYDFRCFFLHRSRLELFERIDLRVEQMIDKGLLQEAQWLLDHGIKPDSNCASRAIGYRQALAALQHWHANPQDITSTQLVQVVKDIQQASRQLNKRQMTWFRDDPMYLWLDATKPKEELVQTISSSLLDPPHKGNCGDSGRLDKAQVNLLKRYRTSLQLFDKSEVQQRALSFVLQTVQQQQHHEQLGKIS